MGHLSPSFPSPYKVSVSFLSIPGRGVLILTDSNWLTFPSLNQPPWLWGMQWAQTSPSWHWPRAGEGWHCKLLMEELGTPERSWHKGETILGCPRPQTSNPGFYLHFRGIPSILYSTVPLCVFHPPTSHRRHLISSPQYSWEGGWVGILPPHRWASEKSNYLLRSSRWEIAGLALESRSCGTKTSVLADSARKIAHYIYDSIWVCMHIWREEFSKLHKWNQVEESAQGVTITWRLAIRKW